MQKMHAEHDASDNLRFRRVLVRMCFSGAENAMQYLIDKYQLVPHPEGGFYREVFRSQHAVHSAAGHKRNAVTHIYFLLAKGEVSRFHKVIHDEVWNFYEGDPLMLIRYDGRSIREELIGRTCDEYASVVEGGTFQAAETSGEYSLVGCTVAPGFQFEDFSFLSHDAAACKKIKAQHPEYSRFV